MTWNFLDSDEASFNTPDLVTSLIHFFATYLPDSIFNIFFSHAHTTPNKVKFLQGKLV